MIGLSYYKYVTKLVKKIKLNTTRILRMLVAFNIIFFTRFVTLTCLLTLKISYIQHEFVRSYASSKIPTIAVPGHVNDVVSVLLFTEQSYLSCFPKLVALRFKKPGAGVAPYACQFILNIYLKQTIWAGPWENMSYFICEQQRRRSACASAQSDQRLCCSLLR